MVLEGEEGDDGEFEFDTVGETCGPDDTDPSRGEGEPPRVLTL